MITHLSTRTVGLNLFGRYRRRRAMQQALTRTYAVFACRYPEWVASLFDEHFVKQALADRSVRRIPQDLADAWAKQMTTKTDRQQVLSALALPIATEFIHLFDQALRALDVLLPTPVQHKDSRDTTAQQTTKG